METYEVLEKALALIEDERNWCQETIQKDRGDGGTARCALGAVMEAEAMGYQCSAGPWRIFTRLAQREGYELGSQFNNNRSHAEVVALFQEAIRSEKAKAGIPIDVPEPQREKANV